MSQDSSATTNHDSDRTDAVSTSTDATDRLAAAWGAGTYDVIAEKYLPMAARLVADAGVGADDAVLDVGCGTGNVAITAARRGADVSGLDSTPSMLERAREIVANAGVERVDWREGSATRLPYDADAFDASLSALGHMYAEPAETATNELVRVTRPGGRIAFTAWTPTGLFPTIAGHLVAALPADAQPDVSEPPFLWGDRTVVGERLGEAVTDLAFGTETARYPALSPAAFWQEQVTHSGVFAAVLEDVEDRAALRSDVLDAIEPFFDPDENVVELEYLRTTATVQ